MEPSSLRKDPGAFQCAINWFRITSSGPQVNIASRSKWDLEFSSSGILLEVVNVCRRNISSNLVELMLLASVLKLVSHDESPNADPAEDSINEEPSLSQDATASSSLPRLCTSALPLANEELSPALLSPLSSNPGLTLESPFPPTNSRMLLGHTTPSHKLPPRAHIQIDILSDFHPDAAFNFRAYDGMEKASNLPISHFSCASLEDITVYKPPSDPVSLRYLDPTVTIALPFHLNAYSAFYVYLDEERAPIHTELASLISTRPEGSSSGPMSYSTTLVPSYWSTLCASEGQSITQSLRTHWLTRILNRT